MTVKDSASSQPVTEALARLLRAQRSALADRLGRIRLGAVLRPDTIVVLAIGLRPDTVEVGEGIRELVILLRRQPIRLSELTVGVEGAELTPSEVGRWVLPRGAMDAIPPAVETDPLRALAALPSVSFSSPLSARPIIRGYDAQENVIRLDGFELHTPYHIGRVFSAVPADVLESVDVAPTPHRVTDGETLAGVVDLIGVQAGVPGRRNSGATVSLASASAWSGWRGPLRGFAGGRVATLSLATDAIGQRVPYAFQDGFAHWSVPLPGARRSELTAYASHDDLGDAAALPPAQGMRWTNVLLGQRTRLVERPQWSIDASASYNRFALDARNIEARFSRINIVSRFQRWNIGTEARGRVGGAEWEAGASIGSRHVVNDLAVLQGTDFPTSARVARLREVTAFGTARFRIGAASLSAGARLDASSQATEVQPRLRLSVPLGAGVTAALSFARAARLYQVITDPQPEPTLAFYDFWVTAGDSGVPVPRVDHVALELDASRGRWAMHLGAYASHGTGIGELRPNEDLRDTAAFRYGDSRTAGVEVRLARRPSSPGGASVVLSYALASSQRRWGDGVWRPWRLDQRHRIRLQADAPLGTRWSAFALAEGRSAQPESRVSEVYYDVSPTIPGDTSHTSAATPAYLYFPEGSARGAGVAFLDLGARGRFDGPWGLRTSVTFSVTNVVFGPVAPLEPVSPFELRSCGVGPCSPGAPLAAVSYRRRFALPAVPSVSVRIEW